LLLILTEIQWQSDPQLKADTNHSNPSSTG